MIRPIQFKLLVIVAVAAFHSIASAGAAGTGGSVCATCHGIDGNSLNPQVPSLAGQDREYLTGQLRAFKSGQRSSDVMNGIAAGLSEAEISDFAAFYTDQELVSQNRAGSLVESGRQKYSTCWGCHGRDALGADGYPRLAGQHSEYTRRQLISFKTGARQNPAMRALVSGLSEEDIAALAAYLSSLKTR